MENKETINAKIYEVEEKESTAGKIYWSVATSKGNFSCFEKDIAEALKGNLGKDYSLDIATSANGKFKNIRKIGLPTEKEEVKTEKIVDNFEDARKLKDISIYTSYAKDLFIAILNHPYSKDSIPMEEMMDIAINRVNQAKKAFS